MEFSIIAELSMSISIFKYSRVSLHDLQLKGLTNLKTFRYKRTKNPHLPIAQFGSPLYSYPHHITTVHAMSIHEKKRSISMYKLPSCMFDKTDFHVTFLSFLYPSFDPRTYKTISTMRNYNRLQ